MDAYHADIIENKFESWITDLDISIGQIGQPTTNENMDPEFHF